MCIDNIIRVGDTVMLINNDKIDHYFKIGDKFIVEVLSSGRAVLRKDGVSYGTVDISKLVKL